jgi:hypothetical protein
LMQRAHSNSPGRSSLRHPKRCWGWSEPGVRSWERQWAVS